MQNRSSQSVTDQDITDQALSGPRIQWVLAPIGGYTITNNNGQGQVAFFHADDDEALDVTVGPEMAELIVRASLDGKSHGIILDAQVLDAVLGEHQAYASPKE